MEITQFQLDALREIGNIGSGHAATALSTLLQRRIDMSVPKVWVVPFEQVANIVIRLERDKTAANEWRRNVMKTTIEKNRFSGMTGPGSYLHYNNKTGRLEELDADEIIEYEAGNERADDRVPF